MLVDGDRARRRNEQCVAVGLGAGERSAWILPDAPARLSTMTGCFQASVSLSATTRAMMSTAPPAANGTIIRIGALGVRGLRKSADRGACQRGPGPMVASKDLRVRPLKLIMRSSRSFKEESTNVPWVMGLRIEADVPPVWAKDPGRCMQRLGTMSRPMMTRTSDQFTA